MIATKTKYKYNCYYCSKGYARKDNYISHIGPCRILHTPSDNQLLDQDTYADATNGEIMRMMVTILNDHNKLRKEFEEYKAKHNCSGKSNTPDVDIKKSEVIIEQLNRTQTPEKDFADLINNVNIDDNVINHMLGLNTNKSVYETFNFALKVNNIYEGVNLPIVAYTHKNDVFYVYENNVTKWVEVENEFLYSQLIVKVYEKIKDGLRAYGINNKDRITENESLSVSFDNARRKINSILNVYKDTQFRRDLYANLKRKFEVVSST